MAWPPRSSVTTTQTSMSWPLGGGFESSRKSVSGLASARDLLAEAAGGRGTHTSRSSSLTVALPLPLGTW